MYYNPTIARLLSKENITVQHGNYHTAWFDIKNRVLGLPLWKDMGKDVYDLFIGHEIGHALYTPYEGWHDSPVKLKGAPRSYINVVEDARIEKFSRRDYPGLVGPFLRGYRTLVEDDFFGPIDDLDFEKIKLIDKINLKAKLGNDIDVPFNPEEERLFDKVMSTETFAEVVELCKEILAYTQENTPELITKPEPPTPAVAPEGTDTSDASEQMDAPQGHDDYEDKESDQTAEANVKTKEKTTREKVDEWYKGTEKNTDAEKSEEKPAEGGVTDKDKEEAHDDEDRSLTDDLQRVSERKLVDLDEVGRQKVYARMPCKKLIDMAIIPFEKLTEQRQATRKGQSFDIEKEGILEGYEEYMIGVKKSARFAVKEFELRKAAYQWQRAATAKTGSLDMNKVHAYRYDEEIFARVTKLANAKNHGMIMFIDYSGSMGRTICQVIDQLIHLVVFCKAINIPFDVYAFTTGNKIDRDMVKEFYRDGDLNLDALSLPLLISSSLKKTQFEDALKQLYMKKQANTYRRRRHWDDPIPKYWSDYSFGAKTEEWGSTPLNTTLVLAHDMVKKFKKRHQIDKMNLIVLSDGDSNMLRTFDFQDKETQARKIETSWRGGMVIEVGRKHLHLKDSGRRATRQLLENIRKTHNVNTIGFFVSDSHYDWRSKLAESERNVREAYGWIDLPKYNKEYRKNKCVTFKDTLGYNEFYLVKGGKGFEADTSEEDFDVKEEASNAQIRTAFKKFSKNKKLNKVLMTNFGKAVA